MFKHYFEHVILRPEKEKILRLWELGLKYPLIDPHIDKLRLVRKSISNMTRKMAKL